MRRQIIVSALTCITIIVAANLPAETRREGGGSGSGQQHMVQQLTQQNAALEQEKAALAEERDGLKAQLVKLNATHADDQQALNHAKDAAASLTGKFNDLLGKHTVLQTQDKSAQEKLQDAERRIKILNGKIADLAHQDAACEGNNRKLYQLNVNLLERYRKKGVFDALLQHEPVTGLNDVEMQNIIQKYRDENDAQRIPESTATSK
jgi:chromosome segregation ATPase